MKGRASKGRTNFPDRGSTQGKRLTSGAGSTATGAAKSLLRLTPSGDAARIWLPTAMMFVVLAVALFATQDAPRFVHWLVAVNVFYSLFLVLTWGAMWPSTPADVRWWALAQKPPRSRWGRFVEVILDRRVFSGGAGMSLIISLSAGGLFLALGLLPRRGEGLGEEPLQTFLSVLGVLLSWALLHTSYAMYYAHLYYRDPDKPGGVEFPGGEEPAALDFAYFAFTIGTAFSTSDVSVSSPKMRRSVLAHSVLAFFYNTAILALVLNLIIFFA